MVMADDSVMVRRGWPQESKKEEEVVSTDLDGSSGLAAGGLVGSGLLEIATLLVDVPDPGDDLLDLGLLGFLGVEDLLLFEWIMRTTSVSGGERR
jgi:hypothetical protein